ncbi:uncharacterized protein LOC117188069 [Drosophila miranda]|uniref:uncharacterized protein LOC117188069 n=1 Tax=Drosophila miranda TaxID=7229 RepID=UPI00143F3B15|nr:uncharacterized protein LOC117188069 [Drosophila miranda]XP_033247246.1 uncharacterized protein LOC117188069 [Drosophila miranda]XP_033247250.1 uncharacterized protein LOC117188069 [Drosophila miranda]
MCYVSTERKLQFNDLEFLKEAHRKLEKHLQLLLLRPIVKEAHRKLEKHLQLLLLRPIVKVSDPVNIRTLSTSTRNSQREYNIRCLLVEGSWNVSSGFPSRVVSTSSDWTAISAPFRRLRFSQKTNTTRLQLTTRASQTVEENGTSSCATAPIWDFMFTTNTRELWW